MVKYRPIKCLCIILQNVSNPVLQATILSILSYLPEERYEFIILSFKNYSEFKKSKEGVKFVSKTCFNKNINIYTFLGISFKYNAFLALLLGFILQLRFRFNLIYVREIWGGLAGDVISKLGRSKLFLDHRGLIAEEIIMRGKVKKSDIKYKLIKAIDVYLVDRADIVTCVSKPIINYFEENGVQKNSIIHMPNCIKRSRFQKITDKKPELKKKHNLTNRFIVSFMGGYVDWYDIDYTINTFRLIKNKLNNSILLIITYEVEVWKKMLRNHFHLSEDEYKILKVPFELIPEYLNIIDLGLLFIKRPNDKYCFPIKYSEYLAAGVPVLTTERILDVSDFTKKNKVGFVFKNMNDSFVKKEFYEYLDYYVVNKDAIKEKCKKAAFEKLEWSKYAAIIDSNINKLY